MNTYLSFKFFCLQLCLPAGLQFRTQKHSLEPKFHSFVVTRENASRYYGYSLIFYEEVRNRNICSAMHTLQVNNLLKKEFKHSTCMYFTIYSNNDYIVAYLNFLIFNCRQCISLNSPVDRHPQDIGRIQEKRVLAHCRDRSNWRHTLARPSPITI